MTPLLGQFVISLDFELMWGVRDQETRNSYGANVLGARKAIPQILERFERNGIHATWATVGMLFAESRDELLAALPPESQRPRYANPVLSSYRYLDELGVDEAQDPMYYGASLVERIAACPGQEIGTHTMSHFYCLEPGATTEAFDADLAAACTLARRRGITMRSIVFPRNQYAPEHLDIARRHGLTYYRGNPPGWVYRPASGRAQHLPRRAMRLFDAYTGLLGSHLYNPGKANVPASHFLRPCPDRLAILHPCHLAVIERAMSHAARTGRGFHLWWHPHNFGRDTDTNLTALDRLLRHFVRLRDAHGMVSCSMAGVASSAGLVPQPTSGGAGLP